MKEKKHKEYMEAYKGDHQEEQHIETQQQQHDFRS